MTEIGYGHHIDSFDDVFFSVGERFAKIAGIGATPSLLDLHPICEYRFQTWNKEHAILFCSTCPL